MTEIGRDAFEGTGLTSIVIPESVTKIGDFAFYGCEGLTSINVSEGNKVYDSRDNCNAIIETASNKLITGCMNTVIPDSVTEIGGGAFSGRTGLTSIVIPNSVTSIGGSAFNGCTGLQSIVIPDSVTSIGGYAFNGCTGLTSIVIQGPVEKIEERAFEGCTSLETLTLAAGIKKISEKAFENCTYAIERINVPAKKADYYKKRLPEALHDLIVELPKEKKTKK